MKLNELSELSLPRRVARAALAPGPGSGWLELFLPPRWPAESGAIAWRLRTPGGTLQHGTLEDLKQLPEAALAARLQVWTCAAETVLLRAQLPTRSASRIRKALPFALEDRLLDPPESLHFSHVSNSDGSLSVAVTSRQRIRDWLAALEAAGLRPESIAPAVFSIPHVPVAWTVGFTASETVLRSGEYSGQGAPLQFDAPAWLELALAEARREERAPERLIVQDPPAGLDLSEWSRVLGIAVVEAAAPRPMPPLPSALSLLDGEFAPRGRWRESAQRFFPAAAMLLVWLVVVGAASVGEWWTLSRAHQAQEEEMRALLMKSFPDTRTILDPARQMQRGVEILSARHRSDIAPDDFLALIARAAPALRAAPQAKLQGIGYSADRALTLTVRVADDAAAAALTKALRSARLEAESGGVQKRGDALEARISLRAPAEAGGKP